MHKENLDKIVFKAYIVLLKNKNTNEERIFKLIENIKPKVVIYHDNLLDREMPSNDNIEIYELERHPEYIRAEMEYIIASTKGTIGKNKLSNAYKELLESMEEHKYTIDDYKNTQEWLDFIQKITIAYGIIEKLFDLEFFKHIDLEKWHKSELEDTLKSILTYIFEDCMNRKKHPIMFLTNRTDYIEFLESIMKRYSVKIEVEKYYI